MRLFRDNILIIALMIVLIAGLLPAESSAQQIYEQNREYEEIVVSFEVPKLINKDIFVQYDGTTVYVPIVELFSLLDININVDIAEKKFYGFFISKDNDYELNLTKNKIKALGKEYPYLASGYIMGENDLYIRVDLYKTIFDINLQFDFTLLRVYLPLNRDFPAYQKLKRKVARDKLKVKKESLKDVVRMNQKREYLSGASVDWVLSTNPLGTSNKHYYGLDIGSMFLGGDLTLSMGGNSNNIFETNQFNYKWHYFYKDSKYLTQVDIGDVNTGGSLSRGITGAMITNKPQVRRQYFQTIDLDGYVGEGWEVELYVDNKLTDYMMTDASGLYSFNTDIFYGASNIILKMYGPNGELKTEEKTIRVPFNLIPKGELEYTIGGGKTTVLSTERKYIQANSYYGVFNSLTMGFNMDIPVGAVDEEKALMGIDATCQLMSNLIVNTSLAPDYALTGAINYSKPSVINVNASYSKMYENIIRNPLDQLSNITFSISSPMKIGSKYLGLRYHVSIDKYPTMTSTNMNYGFNTSINPFHLTYIGKYKSSKFTNRTLSNLASQILISSRLIKFIHPQIKLDYDHSLNEVSKYGLYLTRRLFRTGQISMSMEHNTISKSNTIMVNFNLFSPFADFNSRVMSSNKKVTMNQIQRGSIKYNREDKSIMFDRKNNVGLGTAVVRPFLDDNYNGVMDEGEEYIPGLRAKVNGARVKLKGADKQYYYEGLRPYEDYMVQIDQYSLDNPLLKPTYENYQVKINPNVVTAIEVPIVTASEISGRVERQIGTVKAGIGGIKIILMNLSKETLIELTSFNSGDYYYLGVIPGTYKAFIDQAQLKKYGYTSVPEKIEFEIKPLEGGSVIENINFKLIPTKNQESTE